MKIIGIIPSRMNSVRFPGKALAKLAGKPMLLHVYEAAAGCRALDCVFVATDSPAIADICRQFGMPFLMTKSSHENPTARAQEAASRLDGDYYVMIGGDEPLLTPEDIEAVVRFGVCALEGTGRSTEGAGHPTSFQKSEIKKPTVVNAMSVIPSFREAQDPSNIKLVCNRYGEGLYASRGLIPYPKGRTDTPCRKFVSIGLYTKQALDFFVSTPPGLLEQTEEFDLLRFMEHRKTVLFTEIKGRTLSVDTPEDLETVRRIFLQKSSREESCTYE